MSVRAIHGDCREVLKTLPDESVHCVVTSPPYYALRDYQTAGQIGLETTPDAYVAELVAVFREVKRVLRNDGVLFLNLGDSYSSGPTGSLGYNGNFGSSAALARPSKTNLPGIKPKDLIGIPWAVAFALRTDGWYLRSEIIWHKVNPMPESVTDRPSKAHEQIFLLSKSPRYFYDNIAIAERSVSSIQTERTRLGKKSGLSQECEEQRNSGQLEEIHQRRNVSAQVSPIDEAQIGFEEALRGWKSQGEYPAVSGNTKGARELTAWDTQAPRPHGVNGLRSDSGSMGGNPEGTEFRMRSLRDGETANSRSYNSAFNGGAAHRRQHSSTLPKLQQQEEQQATYRNRRSVWSIATEPFTSAHFATFPTSLIEPCIKAGCPAKACAKCGKPWVREVERGPGMPPVYGGKEYDGPSAHMDNVRKKNSQQWAKWKAAYPDIQKGFSPSCACNAATVPGTCLDPFSGAGTTGLVADRLGRNAILIELNASYAEMSRERIVKDAGLFAEVVG